MPFSVRRAQESDSSALIELRRLLFRETSNMLWEPDEFVQTAEDESKRIARLHGKPNGLILVAEDGGALVGLLTAAGGEVRRLRHSATATFRRRPLRLGRRIGDPAKRSLNALSSS